MNTTFRSAKRRHRLAAFAGCLLLSWFTSNLAQGADADYGSPVFDGSSYVQHGPGPAYGGAYSDYGGNATGIEGRFSATYGEYGAVPGYGRFGSGSSFGSGPLRAAGTGRGEQRGRQATGHPVSPHRKSALNPPHGNSELEFP